MVAHVGLFQNHVVEWIFSTLHMTGLQCVVINLTRRITSEDEPENRIMLWYTIELFFYQMKFHL